MSDECSIFCIDSKAGCSTTYEAFLVSVGLCNNNNNNNERISRALFHLKHVQLR